MISLVISDLHIGSKGCNAKGVYKLLKKTEYDRLILVGDIIDGWLFKKYKKFSDQHTKIIRLLLKISKEKEVIWISGNHDEFLRKYSPIQIGNIKIVDEFQEGTQWFHNNDSVIDLKTYNGEAMFTAIELGESTVLFVLNGAITRQFVIKVVDVVSLTPKVEEVVYKNFDTEPFVNTVV